MGSFSEKFPTDPSLPKFKPEIPEEKSGFKKYVEIDDPKRGVIIKRFYNPLSKEVIEITIDRNTGKELEKIKTNEEQEITGFARQPILHPDDPANILDDIKEIRKQENKIENMGKDPKAKN